MTQHDVVVVGAGPTGLACGIELQQRGLNVVLFDKGCVVNSIYNYPTNMVFFTTPELLEIGEIPMTSLGEKPNRIEALKYYRRVAEHYRLPIRQYERVERIEGEDGAFVVHTEDRTAAHTHPARAKWCSPPGTTTAEPARRSRRGAPKVIHYYKEAHPYYEQDVAVVGGKNSAAIAALELHWSGARVTLIHRGEELSAT